MFRTVLLAVVAWWAATVVTAQTAEPFMGIVNCTDCGGFWRYDFNYETVDADGVSPIMLSAAIFLSAASKNAVVALPFLICTRPRG